MSNDTVTAPGTTEVKKASKGNGKQTTKPVQATLAGGSSDTATVDTTEATDETTDGKKEGGRSTFLKIHNDNYVHHSLFKDLVSISSDLEDGKYSLVLGFRDGRRVSAVIEEEAELIKVTKRMKEYAKNDGADAEQKGRSTFLKIHNENYLHHGLFKELVTITSDDRTSETGSTLLMGFRDGRQVTAAVESDELPKVVKRVKEFAKKYGAQATATASASSDNAEASASKKKKAVAKASTQPAVVETATA